MKTNILACFLFIVFSACQSGQNSQAQAQSTDGVHTVIVKEVLQTSTYTYLLVTENSAENWLALPKMQASPGETYYYKNGFKMTDFESKELERKFKTVYFLESVSTTPDIAVKATSSNPHVAMYQQQPDTAATVQYKAEVIVKKEEVNLQPADQGITIAGLFSDKDKYDGKTIQIRGKVTKFNAKIMGKNWIHIQDGTEYSGKFDLTVTTAIEATLGETIMLEGKIALNKDFGYGYSYEVLLEDARLVTK